jgi:molecular chaperone DnaJ
MAEATLGIKVDIPLLEGGTEPVEITPGTQPGTVLRLPGLGTARLGRRGRGDLLIQVKVDIPTSLTVEQAEALRAFAALRGEKPKEAGRRRRGN